MSDSWRTNLVIHWAHRRSEICGGFTRMGQTQRESNLSASHISFFLPSVFNFPPTSGSSSSRAQLSESNIKINRNELEHRVMLDV